MTFIYTRVTTTCSCPFHANMCHQCIQFKFDSIFLHPKTSVFLVSFVLLLPSLGPSPPSTCGVFYTFLPESDFPICPFQVGWCVPVILSLFSHVISQFCSVRLTFMNSLRFSAIRDPTRLPSLQAWANNLLRFRNLAIGRAMGRKLRRFQFSELASNQAMTCHTCQECKDILNKHIANSKFPCSHISLS